VKVAEHLASAERFEATLRKLDLEADYEAILWARMHAATHYFNAALHARGATSEDWDTLHAEYLRDCPDPDRLAAGLTAELCEVVETMLLLERLRPAFVRGNAPFGPEITARSGEDYARLRATCTRLATPIPPAHAP
jgi:hypothetical protein